MQITTANTPYVGTINFMVNSVCPYPMLDFTSLIHIYQQYYLGESPSYLGESPSYLGESLSYFGEAPSYFGGTPSYLGETPSYFGESLSYLGETPSYFGKGRNNLHTYCSLISKKGVRL